jgi:hypothetical protein
VYVGRVRAYYFSNQIGLHIRKKFEVGVGKEETASNTTNDGQSRKRGNYS